MKIFSNLNLQNSVAQNFVVENLTNDPVSPKAGQFCREVRQPCFQCPPLYILYTCIKNF